LRHGIGKCFVSNRLPQKIGIFPASLSEVSGTSESVYHPYLETHLQKGTVSLKSESVLSAVQERGSASQYTLLSPCRLPYAASQRIPFLLE
jgi:hypothetical protein